jgi:hypothetical protein
MDSASDLHNISKAISEGLSRVSKVLGDGMFDLDTMLLRLEKEVGPMRTSLRVISDSMPGWLSYLMFFLIFFELWGIHRSLQSLDRLSAVLTPALPNAAVLLTGSTIQYPRTLCN